MKTLKDIELDKYSYPTKILKELAIKWVKVNLYAIDKPKEDCPIVTWNYSIAFMNNWIKQFFNITEEDLE